MVLTSPPGPEPEQARQGLCSVRLCRMIQWGDPLLSASPGSRPNQQLGGGSDSLSWIAHRHDGWYQRECSTRCMSAPRIVMFSASNGGYKTISIRTQKITKCWFIYSVPLHHWVVLIVAKSAWQMIIKKCSVKRVRISMWAIVGSPSKGETKAISLISELCTLLSKGGFWLTKWISNSRKVIESLPTS